MEELVKELKSAQSFEEKVEIGKKIRKILENIE